jgi:hypothetical protein
MFGWRLVLLLMKMAKKKFMLLVFLFDHQLQLKKPMISIEQLLFMHLCEPLQALKLALKGNLCTQHVVLY